ncbi:hypothetical protein [Chroococcidiopsis sp. CCALA 051]|uniref:hypothetical protein n=1 Tax=Chroococcidiopsis sp. CCALA 051 TaxID=869949 RepID=UPI001E308D5D|nr:hypothetical protein [Chroococcidiopsis sp. CCALA 051]
MVKPTLALTVTSPIESNSTAIFDNQSGNHKQIKLIQLTKKLGQATLATASAASAAVGLDDENRELIQLTKKVGEAALATASATSAAAGLSGGAGIMSGLASAGAIVGGGAVAGLGVLSAGPAAVTTMVMDRVLKDDENLTDNERQARAVGRTMTTVGAAAATAGSVSTLAAVGSVTGLSAAGITSGLATIGGVVGGGMAAGVTVTVAAPAVVAAGAGYGAYKIWKHVSKD